MENATPILPIFVERDTQENIQENTNIKVVEFDKDDNNVTQKVTPPETNISECNILGKEVVTPAIINVDDTEDLFQRLTKVRNVLNNLVLERKEAIDGILLTILADSSCLFIGSPGTAKTQMVRMASTLFGLVSFDILLGETTKPEQIFGPTNIPALANGKLYTSTEGYAPTCEVLFLDEVFKANGTVLNPLLWLINEKQYRNGDLGVQDCPIKAIFGASNELPDDDSLSAFYDRLVLRYEVESLKSVSSIQKMIQSYTSGIQSHLQPYFDRDSFERLRSLVKSVIVPDDLIVTLYNIKCQLERVHKISISDRRLNKCVRLIQAQAVLNGRSVAELEDLEVLCHCMWDTLALKSKVQSTIMSFINTSIPQLYLYKDMCKNIVDTAISSGNIKTGVKKLKKLRKVVSPYRGNVAEQVYTDISTSYKRLKDILEKRATFLIYAIADGSRTVYQVDGVTASLWTYKQMRQCQFKQKRKGNYWYSVDKKSDIIARVNATLGVVCVVKKL